MTTDLIRGIQEINETLSGIEKELAELIARFPSLEEMLGENFLGRERNSRSLERVKSRLNRTARKVQQVQAALETLEYFERNPWPEAVLKMCTLK